MTSAARNHCLRIEGQGTVENYRFAQHSEKPNGIAGVIRKNLDRDEAIRIESLDVIAEALRGGATVQPYVDGIGCSMCFLDFDKADEYPPEQAFKDMGEFGLKPVMFYHTFHWTEENPKFRVVFSNSEPLGRDDFETVILTLLHKFPMADPSCRDIRRYFFGSNGHIEVFADNDGAVNLLEWARDAQKTEAEPRMAHKNVMPAPRTFDYTYSAALKHAVMEYPFLDEIRRDTGEQGRASSDKVLFETCPICGHHGCFRFYPGTNTYDCFSTSADGCGNAGGDILHYLQRRDGIGYLDALRIVAPELVRVDQNPAQKAGDGPLKGESRASTPSRLEVPSFSPSHLFDPPPLAPVLIDGLLRKGHKALLTSQSKAGKTWLTLSLAVSVAMGREWLGFKCNPGRVLFVNPELDPPSAVKRLVNVAKAMELSEDELHTLDNRFTWWHLRGCGASAEAIFSKLTEMAKGAGFALIVLDSVFKLFDGDENRAQDVKTLWSQIDVLTRKSGAAMVASHHHSKGAKGDVSAIDRGSGSGVWQRDPDLCLDMVEVFPSDGATPFADGERAFQLTCSGIREFAGFEPLHLVYRWPLFSLDADGITAGWKASSAAQKGGRTTGEASKMRRLVEVARRQSLILAYFAAHPEKAFDGITLKDAAGLTGSKNATRLREEVEEDELLAIEEVSNRKWVVKPVQLPMVQQQC